MNSLWLNEKAIEDFHKLEKDLETQVCIRSWDFWN